MKQEFDDDPHSVYQDRMTAFLGAIKKYQKKNLDQINSRFDREEKQEVGKINNDASRQNEQEFKKLEDNVKVAEKIFKSRKLNECRMREMKVRFDMIQQIQSQAKKTLLKQVQSVEKYKALLKVLIKQGMIKLLEEQVDIRCLRNEEKIVAEVINECQQQFNSICEVSTKLQINKNNYLQAEDLGGVVLTSFKGKIVCDNTLRARLSYCVQLLLPEIRGLLFQDSDKWLEQRKKEKKGRQLERRQLQAAKANHH